METFLEHYWPHILAAISFLLGATAAIHAAMTKDEVRDHTMGSHHSAPPAAHKHPMRCPHHPFIAH